MHRLFFFFLKPIAPVGLFEEYEKLPSAAPLNRNGVLPNDPVLFSQSVSSCEGFLSLLHAAKITFITGSVRNASHDRLRNASPSYRAGRKVAAPPPTQVVAPESSFTFTC
ncbi:hypothetical protein E2C01_069831 [Portunus trituberculatus]|uniref:Uncharacterized protein n=1 Tax=Portunus trituberculatus TaxID=210409 RepID=A0A5B7I3U9_PORTR|nr:hypothetical protein [Portunus trituberculatus]